MRTIRIYAYYILIGIISFLSVAFLPMLNSSFDVDYKLPKTTAAWFIWAGTRTAVSTLNIMIFHCFVKQGDINTKNNENRKKAEKLLQITKEEQDFKPKSPKEFFSQEYEKKIPTILLTTILSLFAFGPAILTFDLVTFFSYLFTVVISLVFGVIELFKVEDYYTIELLKYAEYLKEQDDLKEKEQEFERLKIENKLKKNNLENLNTCQFIGHKEDISWH